MDNHEEKMLEGGFQMSGKSKPKPVKPRGQGGRGSGRGRGPSRAGTSSGSHSRHQHPPNTHPSNSSNTTLYSGFRYDRRNQSKTEDRTETETQSLVSKINAAKSSISRSEWFKSVLSVFSRARCPSVDSLVSYGIGSLEDSVRSQIQTAFMLILGEALQVKESFVYDPVFTQIDLKALRSLGISIVEQNEQGNRSISGKTVFFMPHCGRRLYENVLRSNWKMESLSQIYILGNPVSRMKDMKRPGPAAPSSVSDALHLAAPFVHEYALPTYEDRPDAFSDTSLQFFRTIADDPPVLPSQTDAQFWKVPPSSPETSDPEVR